jgi:peptidyl-prolyl cis-trans isomerase-like 1
VTKRLTR